MLAISEYLFFKTAKTVLCETANAFRIHEYISEFVNTFHGIFLESFYTYQNEYVLHLTFKPSITFKPIKQFLFVTTPKEALYY